MSYGCPSATNSPGFRIQYSRAFELPLSSDVCDNIGAIDNEFKLQSNRSFQEKSRSMSWFFKPKNYLNEGKRQNIKSLGLHQQVQNFEAQQSKNCQDDNQQKSRSSIQHPNPFRGPFQTCKNHRAEIIDEIKDVAPEVTRNQERRSRGAERYQPPQKVPKGDSNYSPIILKLHTRASNLQVLQQNPADPKPTPSSPFPVICFSRKPTGWKIKQTTPERKQSSPDEQFTMSPSTSSNLTNTQAKNIHFQGKQVDLNERKAMILSAIQVGPDESGKIHPIPKKLEEKQFQLCENLPRSKSLETEIIESCPTNGLGNTFQCCKDLVMAQLAPATLKMENSKKVQFSQYATNLELRENHVGLDERKTVPLYSVNDSSKVAQFSLPSENVQFFERRVELSENRAMPKSSMTENIGTWSKALSARSAPTCKEVVNQQKSQSLVTSLTRENSETVPLDDPGMNPEFRGKSDELNETQSILASLMWDKSKILPSDLLIMIKKFHAKQGGLNKTQPVLRTDNEKGAPFDQKTMNQELQNKPVELSKTRFMSKDNSKAILLDKFRGNQAGMNEIQSMPLSLVPRSPKVSQPRPFNRNMRTYEEAVEMCKPLAVPIASPEDKVRMNPGELAGMNEIQSMPLSLVPRSPKVSQPRPLLKSMETNEEAKTMVKPRPVTENTMDCQTTLTTNKGQFCKNLVKMNAIPAVPIYSVIENNEADPTCLSFGKRHFFESPDTWGEKQEEATDLSFKKARLCEKDPAKVIDPGNSKVPNLEARLSYLLKEKEDLLRRIHQKKNDEWDEKRRIQQPKQVIRDKRSSLSQNHKLESRKDPEEMVPPTFKRFSSSNHGYDLNILKKLNRPIPLTSSTTLYPPLSYVKLRPALKRPLPSPPNVVIQRLGRPLKKVRLDEVLKVQRQSKSSEQDQLSEVDANLTSKIFRNDLNPCEHEELMPYDLRFF